MEFGQGYAPVSSAKVLIFSTGKSGSGVAQFCEHIAAALAAAGRGVVIAQPPEPDYTARMGSVAKVERRAFDKDPYEDVAAFGENRTLAARLFAEIEPKLVVFLTGVHPLASAGALYAARRLRIPYVIVDGLVAASLYHWEGRIAQMMHGLYRDAAAVIVKSQENLKTLRQCLKLPDQTGQVIVSGRPETFFSPQDPDRRARLRRELGLTSDAVLCLTAAKLEIVKGHALQIEAMRHLKTHVAWRRLHFAWIGDGVGREELASALAVEGVTDRVHLVGHSTDIAGWMDAADIYVLTSHSEGMPLSVMEAMAKGLPVIATAVGGTAEALGDTGFLVTRPAYTDRCIGDLVDALERLASDDMVRKEMGRACRTRAEAQFRLDRMTADYLRVFDAAMDGT